jgi:hypothetical protein
LHKKFRNILANDHLSFLRLATWSRDYQSRFGVLHGVIPEVVNKFTDCGDFTADC